MKTDEQHKAGIEIYRKVKGGLVAQGSSLTKWCEDHGTQIANVRHAFYGSWNGPRAEQIVKQACIDAGVELEDVA